MTERLYPKRPVVAIVGRYKGGKSTLLNCLLDDKYAATKDGLRTTRRVARYVWGDADMACLHRPDGSVETLDRREDIFSADFNPPEGSTIEISCWKDLLRKVDILDTPGFDVKESDDEISRNVILNEADVLIFLVEPKAPYDECIGKEIECAKQAHKRFFFLMNCSNLGVWSPADEQNRKLCVGLASALGNAGVRDLLMQVQPGIDVWPVNPLWAWYGIGQLDRETDGDAASKLKQVRNSIRDDYPELKTRGDVLKVSNVIPVRKALQEYAQRRRLCYTQNVEETAEQVARMWYDSAFITFAKALSRKA